MDFLRGFALLLMIYFHLIYSLKEFGDYPINYASGINFYVGRLSGTLFIVISGISSLLAKNNYKRGWKLLGFAMLISIATHLYNLDYGIKFGILHFLGISMLLSPILIKINKRCLFLLGTAIILIGISLGGMTISTDYLFPLGIRSPGFSSADYYPLFPWVGVFIYGIAWGKLLYNRRRSILPFSMDDHIITRIGRRTLPVYLMHQPVILIMLIAINYLTP